MAQEAQPSDPVIRLIVTHFIKRARQNGWIALPFITQEQGGSTAIYYQGFETFQPYDVTKIIEEERIGSIARLAQAYPIRTEQCLWLTETGDVWLASYDDPLNDTTRILIGQNAP